MHIGTLGPRDVQEISEARIALETFAARTVAARSEPSLAEAEESLARFAGAIKARTWVAVVDADVRFHRSIVVATGNSRLMQFWSDLEPQLRLYLSYHAEDAYDLPHVLDAHKNLLAAVRSGHPARAAEAFRAEIIERTGRRLAFWTKAARRDVPPPVRARRRRA